MGHPETVDVRSDKLAFDQIGSYPLTLATIGGDHVAGPGADTSDVILPIRDCDSFRLVNAPWPVTSARMRGLPQVSSLNACVSFIRGSSVAFSHGSPAWSAAIRVVITAFRYLQAIAHASYRQFGLVEWSQRLDGVDF